MHAMSYVLATAENIVRWYVYDIADTDKGFELVTELDLKKVQLLADMAAAKLCAKALGLET